MSDFLDEFDLGSPRGGRKPEKHQLEVSVVRSLSRDDLLALSDGSSPLLPSTAPSITEIKHSHHMLAQLLAKGTSQVEASLITGYTQSHISIIKGAPAFQELLSYYESQREAVFVDTLERMRVLGLNTLEQIHKSIDDSPESWSNREKMELVELMLVKPQAAMRGNSGGSGPGVSVSVSFVEAAQPSPSTQTRRDTPILDLEPNT